MLCQVMWTAVKLLFVSSEDKQMTQRIIYKTSDGTVCVLTPILNCGLTIKEIADKDVPEGLGYKIVGVMEIPVDRTFRDAWDLDAGLMNDGVGTQL